MYVVTKAGRDAWESQDTSVPEQYRRLLWLIDVQGGARAVKGLCQDHPERLIRDWLGELNELGFIQPRQPGPDDTTISLTLNEPALQAGANAVASLSGTGAYLAVNPSSQACPPKAPAQSTVLIVEDDPDQLALADLRVTMAGYRVRVAASIDELLKSLLNEASPDLLLLDGVLPDGNGFDVMAKIRRHPKFASLPIVMLTAERDPVDIGRGLALGANGYVTKPYSKNLLSHVIHRVLNGT